MRDLRDCGQYRLFATGGVDDAPALDTLRVGVVIEATIGWAKVAASIPLGRVTTTLKVDAPQPSSPSERLEDRGDAKLVRWLGKLFRHARALEVLRELSHWLPSSALSKPIEGRNVATVLL